MRKIRHRQLLLAAACLFVVIYGEEDGGVIRRGRSVDEVSRAMIDGGYKEGGFDIIAQKKGAHLKQWTVGEGALVCEYDTSSHLVTGLEYCLADERQKADRKMFFFFVDNFDAKSGALLISIKGPKENENPLVRAPIENASRDRPPGDAGR